MDNFVEINVEIERQTNHTELLKAYLEENTVNGEEKDDVKL